MKLFSDCSGPCETCANNKPGLNCLAGHGDDHYVERDDAQPHEILQVRTVQSGTPHEACEQADSSRDPGGPAEGEGRSATGEAPRRDDLAAPVWLMGKTSFYYNGEFLGDRELDCD